MNQETLPIQEYAEQAYLDYSMYVILDRALPHIADGLKPVQRRIIYAMSELGLSAGSKHKKSARTIGDVLGKFHPHGDSACYEAMVHMAQPFSYRYTFVDGQGNWGSQDEPKSFAAMRYTESRLTEYAKVLLQEAALGTVEWVDNYDGTQTEPELLPARLPNVLLNGAAGIAVGMATDIPSHNLVEVVDACIHLLENKDADIDDVLKIVKGPDFPVEAEIVSPKASIHEAYRTGSGSIKQRASYHIEDGEIIIDSLPYQVSGAKVLMAIAELIRQKKLPLVSDLRDESDADNPVRLVITPRSNRVDVEALMLHLFAVSDLEKNYRINMNMIGLDGRPQVKNLFEILSEWLVFRRNTVTKRTEWRLDKVAKRLHVLEALHIAHLNIDQVIAIIRDNDEPKPILMKTFSLSEIQAEAILNLRLRHLAKIEEMEIIKEKEALQQEHNELSALLGSDSQMTALIIEELQHDKDKFGDVRRCRIVARDDAKVIDESQLIAAEPLTVVLSKMGWIRAAKGHDIDASKLNFKQGDALLDTDTGRSNHQAVVMDQDGKAYTMPAHQLPSARGLGDPLAAYFNIQNPALAGVVLCAAEEQVMLCNTMGYGFAVPAKALHSKVKGGKNIVNTMADSSLLAPLKHKADAQYLAVVSSDGYLLIMPMSEVPVLNKGKGNKLMGVPKKALQDGVRITAVAVLSEECHLIVHAGKKFKQISGEEMKEYWGARATRGQQLPRGYQNVTELEIAVQS